jgi:hypothetical protein
MRRRDFIQNIAGSAPWPLAARAQEAEPRPTPFPSSLKLQFDPIVEALIYARD